MNDYDDNHWTRWVGGAVFVACTMCTALDQAGFIMFGFPLGLPTCLVLAIFGGAIGGALSVRCWPAGFAGGMVAGPGCLLSVYLYARGVDLIHKAELAMLMVAGSLPGVAVYYLCRWYLTGNLLGEVAQESADEAPDSVDGVAFDTLRAQLDDGYRIPAGFEKSSTRIQP